MAVASRLDGAMPELPDVTVYVERLRALVGGRRIEAVRLRSPFLVRTFDPPLESVIGRKITGARRLGKRIVLELEGDLFLVIHLMIAGRFQWKEPKTELKGKLNLLAFDFEHGSLFLTEAGTKKRASLYVVKGEAGLADHHRGGLEPLGSSLDDFARALRCENHTLKRSLTDPRLFSGIGNAYSDEILHRARLSPMSLTSKLADEEITVLHRACQEVLVEWTDRLRDQAGSGIPSKVTAFHEEMAVHGKFGKPCPVCGTKVQRIRYAANEVNYCPECQTRGRLLSDRSLSRLLRDDFPRSLEELEEYKAERKIER
jgi:formamidopyrimidine-DNA glycosylase